MPGLEPGGGNLVQVQLLSTAPLGEPERLAGALAMRCGGSVTLVLHELTRPTTGFLNSRHEETVYQVKPMTLIKGGLAERLQADRCFFRKMNWLWSQA